MRAMPKPPVPQTLLRRTSLCIALALLGALPAVAQQPDTASSAPVEVEEICVNLVCLEGVDRAVYMGLRDRIEAGLEQGDSVEERLGTIAELFAAIDDLEELRPTFRHSLRNEVLDSAQAAGALDPPLISALLRSTNEDLEDLALSALLQEEDTWKEESIHGALLALLHDPNRSDESRESVLWLFHYSGAFSEVSDFALAATGNEQAPELAHKAAQVLIYDAQEEDREIWIREAFRSGPPALRRAAALGLLEKGDLEATDPLYEPAVRTVAAVALDSEASPYRRGRAIEGIGRRPSAEPNRSVLLELLDPQNWFYGATGAHFPIHSLALVIKALQRVEDPVVRDRLEALRPEIRALPSGQREYVEWVLGLALGDHEEIFHGPVEWEEGRLPSSLDGVPGRQPPPLQLG